MKILLALLCSFFLSAQLVSQVATEKSKAAEPEVAEEPVKKSVPKAPVRIPPPKKEDEKAAVKKADAVKKAEPEKKEEAKIKGITVPRGERGFLGVEIVNGAFKITFYDAKKKAVKPDVARAALRWDAKYKIGQERLVLNPDADGKSLSNPRTIRAPDNFKLYITLIKEATEKEDAVGETHVIDFKA